MSEQAREWVDRLEMVLAVMIVVGAGKALLEIPWLAGAAAMVGFLVYEVNKWLAPGQKSPQQLN